jgi:transcription antitermination factor NusG
MVARDFRDQHQLARDGYELWLPECVIVRKMRRSRDRGCDTTVRFKGPWFPGYLFVRLDLARHDWRAFDEVDGAAAFLLDGGRPRAIADDRIAGLRAACDAKTGMAMIRVRPSDGYSKGQRLHVIAGPFASFDGLFSEQVGERVKVMLEIFGRETPYWLDEAQVEAAS